MGEGIPTGAASTLSPSVAVDTVLAGDGRVCEAAGDGAEATEGLPTAPTVTFGFTAAPGGETVNTLANVLCVSDEQVDRVDVSILLSHRVNAFTMVRTYT